MENPRYDFQLSCRDGRFELREDRTLLPPVREYLEGYLRRVSRRRPIGFFRGEPVTSLYQAPLSSAAGIRSLKMRLLRRFEGRRIPAVATFAVNRACQCSCAHCSALDYNRSVGRDLTTGVWLGAVAQSVRLGVTQIIFVGGEPLLRRDLNELLRSVSSREAHAILFTNGEYMTELEAEKLAAAGLMGAFVSLDAADPREHDCFAANTQFYLGAGGEMCPCDFTPLSVGRFPEATIETLWRRMISSPPYHCRAKACRMQDRGFRRVWIDSIPEGAALPWPLNQTLGDQGPG